MKKLLAILISILFFIPVMPTLMAMPQPQQIYISPNLQGVPILPLSPDTPIYLNIFDLPKNMNLLLFDTQRIYNGQLHLTKQEVINKFAPIDKIEQQASFLQSQGFTIVFKTPFSLIAEAPAAIVNQVFNTTLYLYNVNGKIVYKPLKDPVIPPILRNALITGLTNYTSVEHSFKPQYITLGKLVNGFLKINSDFAFSNLHFAYTYYTPKDLQGVYNVTLSDGENVTIAIIDAYGDPLIQQDLQQFDSEFGLPPANLTIIPIGPYRPELGVFSGWDVETALDVEATHLMAPKANIQLIVTYDASFSAILQAIIYVVSEGKAQVVSMSFGAPENLFSASGLYAYYAGEAFPNYPLVDYYFALGTAEGITFVASSGDYGAYGYYISPTYYGGVSFPSSSPFVLSVGGTTLYANITSGYISARNSSATYGYETAWSVLPQYVGYFTSTVSSGGGYSTFFPAPYWQRSITNSSFRATPDVAAVGNPYTGLIIIVEGTETVIGGTSLSAPLWAGAIADIDSYVGHPIGLISPILYEIYHNVAVYDKLFHQVTLGFNGEYLAHAGYNLVTGLGSPNVGLLKEYIKQYLASHQSLKISLMTYEVGVTVPWYMYNSTFTIVADISYPDNTSVINGSFTAYIYTLSGYLDKVELTFNGTYWVGEYTISPGQPPNMWTIVVNGTSGKYSGEAMTDIDVGESINIISPVAEVIPINTPFRIEVYAYYPDGSPVEEGNLRAYLIHDGKSIFNITLIPSSEPGLYTGIGAILYPQPQGTYLLVVNDTYGSAYGWDYVGLVTLGAILPPIFNGFASVGPGDNITVLGASFTILGLGLFTSQVTAMLLTLNGTVIEKVPMKLAPATVQFGIFKLFGWHIVNITIPSGIKPGFYKIVVEAKLNTSTGPLYGNFTSFIYVSNFTLKYQLRSLTTVVEGQYVKVIANITYPNGTEVKYGQFTAGFIPVELNYASILVEYYNGIPLQYNYTTKLWEGIYQIPSVLTEQGTIYEGAPVQSLAGPWEIYVIGTSADGTNLVTSPSYFTVLPYTYLGNLILTNNNISKVPLISYNGTAYILQGIYAGSLRIQNLKYPISIVNSYINSLYVENSTIELSNSRIVNITAYNSKITLIQDIIGGSNTAITAINAKVIIIASVIHDVKYAFNYTNSLIEVDGVAYQNVGMKSALPPPYIASYSPANVTTSKATIAINIYGKELKITGVSINGIPTPYNVSSTPNGLQVLIPFDASKLPAGPYTITLNVSNGLQYSFIVTVYNTYPQLTVASSISKVDSTAGVSEILGILGIILGLIAILLVIFRSRGGGGERK